MEGSILSPAEGVVFVMFEAGSADAVGRAGERGSSPFERVAEGIQTTTAAEVLP